MRCERCGYENYDESHYCKRCWAELASFDNEGSDDNLSRYKNRSSYQQTYNYKKDMYDGNNKYIRGLYNMDTNNNYADINEQYPVNNSTQYDNNNGYNTQQYNGQYSVNNSTQYNNDGYNTQQYNNDNTFVGNENYNSAGAYDEPESKGTYNYYKGYSGRNSYSYINYEGATDEESEKRKRRIRNIRNSTTILGVIPIILIAVISVLDALETVGVINFFKGSESPQVVESTTVQATEPTIPEAKLGNSMYSIIDTDIQSVEVSYHPPKGYKFIDNGVVSCAVFESEIYGNKVSLTTMFFNGDIQEEIDYYESIGERDDTEVEISNVTTNIGKMVEIGIVTNGKGINYQFYIEISKDRYLYVSMTNIPFNYLEDAKTIIKLFMEDLEVSYLPVEEPTEVQTEALTE